MKSVLFLLDYYLPNASANGICASKVIQKFLEEGIQVSVVCYRGESICRMGGATEEVYSIASHLPKRKGSHKVFYYLKWLFAKKRLPYENKRIGEELFGLAENIVAKNAVDTVVCIHLPIETLLVGKRLKDKYSHLNVVAYMLDSLSGGFLPRWLPAAFCRRKKINWENKNLNRFDKVILMESSRPHHEKYSKSVNWYKENSVFLDVPALVASSRTSGKKNEREEIVVCFLGTMAPGVRSPYAFLDILFNIVDLKMKVLFIGKNSCDVSKYITRSGNIHVDAKGELPYAMAQEYLDEADFLLNLGNVNPNLVPSKIFEYMAYGKPIISTYTCENDSSLQYLRKYPAVHLVDEKEKDRTALAERLETFIKAHRNANISTASIEQYFYKNTPMALYDFLIGGEKNEKL